MQAIRTFLAAAILAVLFAVIFGVAFTNSPIIGGAAFNASHLPPLSQEFRKAIIGDRKASCPQKEVSSGPLVLEDGILKHSPSTYQDDKAFLLHCAAHDNALKTALSLVKKGADVTATNRYGITPLDIAIVKHGKDSVIALFLQGAMEKQGKKNRQQADELLRELE